MTNDTESRRVRPIACLAALALAIGAVLLAADGPLTNGGNLPVRTDANGYLLLAAQTYTGPDGPRRPLANALVRTDANGYLIVTNPAGFGGGGAWGSITGTLANQTDLQSALDLKAPAGALYWTAAADSTLSAEKNLGALSTGLVINTSGTPSAYAGTSCPGQAVQSLDSLGAATCVGATVDQAAILIRTSLRF